MSILSKNDQRGRSMVEMLGVLAIIGVLSVGGISGYSKAMAKFKLTKAQDQISMLLMNIRTAFATSPSYEDLSNKTAVEFAIAPGDMFSGKISAVTDTALNNAFGGGAYVFSCEHTAYTDANGTVQCGGITASSDATKSQFFAIAMTNLGREACVSLLSSDWGTDGLVHVEVIGSDQTNNGNKYPSDKLPIGMIDAGKSCPSYGKRAGIIWTYY
jgi:type II secretory pathway pseudopilin PulG